MCVLRVSVFPLWAKPRYGFWNRCEKAKFNMKVFQGSKPMSYQPSYLYIMLLSCCCTMENSGTSWHQEDGKFTRDHTLLLESNCGSDYSFFCVFLLRLSRAQKSVSIAKNCSIPDMKHNANIYSVHTFLFLFFFFKAETDQFFVVVWEIVWNLKNIWRSCWCSIYFIYSFILFRYYSKILK